MLVEYKIHAIITSEEIAYIGPKVLGTLFEMGLQRIYTQGGATYFEATTIKIKIAPIDIEHYDVEITASNIDTIVYINNLLMGQESTTTTSV